MTDPFEKRLRQELDQRRQSQLLRTLAVRPECRLDLSSNDYLQLRHHPDVLSGARQALEQYGASTSASPLLTGYLPCHDQLLKKLLDWKGRRSGLLFNTGFMANQAVLKHLPGPRDLVLVDRLVHHSVIQAVLQGKADYKRYNHLDLAHLEELLDKHQAEYETVFVATESVFSMDGDYPDLAALVEIKKRFPFILVLDEAHATGVFGPTGGGLAEEAEVLEHVDILVGTLGKSLASMGAYVLSHSQDVTDYLVNYAGELIYSTYLAPACAGAASAAVDLVRQADASRRQLRTMARRFRGQLQHSGWQTLDGESPIIPILLEEPAQALDLRDHLRSHGVLAGAVRPPTVPPNSSRVRLSFHSGVDEAQANHLLDLLKQWKDR